MATEYFNDAWRIPNNKNQSLVSNYSMEFNGTSDKIEVQDASNEFGFSNNSFSLSAWVFIDSVSTQNGIIAKRNIGGNASNKMWYFEINTSSQLRFLWYTSSSSSNTSSTDTIPLNTWTHVVVTSNGAGANGLTFYINGTPDSGGFKTGPSSASSIQQTGTPLWVGARGGNTTAQYTNGKIDQVTFFDYALPATGTNSVATLYGGGTAITNPMSLSPKPIAYYQLGDQSVYNGANYLVPNNSLSGSEGFSRYALSFDGLNDSLNFNNAGSNIMTNKNAISVSGWFKLDSNISSVVCSSWYGGAAAQYLLRYNSSTGLGIQWYIYSNSNPYRIDTNYFPAVGDWVHVVGVKDPITNGGQIRVYINGFEYTLDNTDFSIAIAGINGADQIGLFSSASNFMNGSISNVAYWTDTALTQAQVTEIYNSGVPSNLNTFSGTAPAHWLQLGSNSSFNPNPTGTEGTWTCLDEIGTNNAESSNNMTEDAITNGVGYSGNGLGTSSIEIVGDAPYSTANGISENMDVLDRTTDVPS
jgi:hypothetical protein